jgi:hypothetical protein
MFKDHVVIYGIWVYFETVGGLTVATKEIFIYNTLTTQSEAPPPAASHGKGRLSS